MSSRHTVIPAVWMIVMNEKDQVFMLRRANTGWRDGWWTVPAGHVEKEEGPTGAAIRELKEEAGIIAKPEDISDPLVYFYPEDERINERVSVFFAVRTYQGEPSNVEPQKADAAQWFDVDELPELVPPLLRRAFKDFRDGVRYSERYYDDELHAELV